ncbi:hypothetical protein J23TS9_49270 [Paenibacillus sp. J23TS9]|uniref:CAP domain-containing protein n=1 Tax=Paenibacillus sp. J23TS9 TaxID=2807193 RepID=UPI001B25A357|nr:CAP domain-containing protein [Paenibacillus sp. J23TS9]GIP29797.1 hypothetical protein J23TS9_49270 [Paenibacillus sp. J23TS9]
MHIKDDNQTRYFFHRRILVSVISAGMLLGGVTFAHQGYAAAVSAGTGINQDQNDALAYLNSIRAKLGLQALKYNGNMSKAAQLHAVYYNMNHEKASQSAHSESKGLPGFKGSTIVDRLKASGWSPGPNGYMTGEAMHYEQTTIKGAIEEWLDTAYHREIILSHKYTEVGIGFVNGTAVLDMAGPYDPTPIKSGIAVYPYDGMKNVGVGFYGNENPNPLSQFNIKSSGCIISATTEKEMVWHQAKITDQNGKEIPIFEELHNKDTLFLYPKYVLKGNHTYQISLSYEMKGSPGKKKKMWSFTTGESPKEDVESETSSTIK